MAQPIMTSLDEISAFAAFENDQYVYREFTYWTPDNEAWHGTVQKENPDEDPTLDEINKHLRRVEEAHIYPEPPAWTIKNADINLPNVHIKQPSCPSPDDYEIIRCSQILLHEISIMERIPEHPNIVKYYVCCMCRGRITGIVMESLGETVEESPHVASTEIPTFLAELQSAVDHLHSLGLAYNDINPNNIMLTKMAILF